MTTASVEEAKAELYGQPVGSFVAERDVLVKAIRAGGDRALANEVKALRKPSAVAAEVNQIVRADPDGVELILQAAALLRSAQAGALDGTVINASELQQQYRAAIQGLSQAATSRQAEVRAALEAATIDQASNEALRTGCLVAVPTPISIFGSTASAMTPTSGSKPAIETATEALPAQPVDELEERRARRRAGGSSKTEASKTKASKSKAAPTAQKAAVEAERQRKAAAQKAAVEAERERKAAAKKAAAEAERQRKAAEKERQKKRKGLQKRHREALRAHLAALDAEAAASLAVAASEQDLSARDAEIDAAERTLSELHAARHDIVAKRDESEQAERDAHLRAEEADAKVAAIAQELSALEES